MGMGLALLIDLIFKTNRIIMKKIFLGLFSALLLVSCGGATTDTKKEAPKKDISLQLYSLRKDIKDDYAGTIKKAGEIGYTSVEAAGYGDGKFYGKTPEEFKADLQAAGMTALSSHTKRDLTEEELAKKDFTEALKWWEQALDAAKAAGMSYVVMPSMPNAKKLETLANLQTYCEYYNEVGKMAKSKGLEFGYHNHAFEFEKIEDKVMYDYLLENTNPEFVFFQMDVYWVVRGQQSPVDYFHKYANRFKVLHIKDNKELGQSGMVGFDAIFKAENTDAAGVKHLVVEVEKYNLEPLESVKVSLDYLRQLDAVKVSYAK